MMMMFLTLALMLSLSLSLLGGHISVASYRYFSVSSLEEADGLCGLYSTITNAASKMSSWNCLNGMAMSDPCITPETSSWVGVTCNASTIIGLSLSSMGLVGSISPNLGQVIGLKSIAFSNNSLIGSIPSSFSALTNMASLSLEGNMLTGQLPFQLSSLSSLVELSVGRWPAGGNLLTGSIPYQLSALTKLEILNLYLNNFSSDSFGSPLPSQLQSLKMLKELDMGSNGIEATIPSWICSFQYLQQLVFETNRIRSTIPDCLSNISKNFFKLEINNNLMTGILPSNIGSISTMKYIHLDSNSFHGSIPSQIVSLPNLLQFTISNNRMGYEVSSDICRSSSSPPFRVDISNNPNITCIPSCLTSNANADFYYDSSPTLCSPSPTSSSSDKNSLSDIAVAGIVMASLFVLIVIAGIVSRHFRKRENLLLAPEGKNSEISMHDSASMQRA